MKYVLGTLLIVPLLTLSQEKNDVRQQVWSILENNNPDAHSMLKQLYAMPQKFKLGTSNMTVSKPTDFMEYLGDNDLESILSNISTAVHEGCHMYQSQKGFQIIDDENLPYTFGTQYSVYYIDSEKEYLVKETPVFPSIHIARFVPKELRKSRFDTYINSRNKILGTQQSGIYGLLDEWSAYYNGFKTTVLNHPIYEERGNKDSDFLLNYVSDASSSKLSYYEFKYFILQYLSFATNHQKKIYRELMNNDAFRIAFRAIDQAFEEIIVDHDRKLLHIQSNVESTGKRFERTEDYFWIGNKGVGTYDDEVKAFKKALSNPEFEPILAALIK